MDNISKQIDLVEMLKDKVGVSYVYCQSPENIKMGYPCIKCNISSKKYTYADNKKYRTKNRYTLILIDKNPNSEYQDKLEELDNCEFINSYGKSGLNYFVYALYY